MNGDYISSWDTTGCGAVYPHGITTYGDYIWFTDSGTTEVYKYSK